ncbi:GIY-YIG nuclease family protein [Burkholderia cenocepacia]|uniref:GIY-YIG nuclease family protein n=4 Tax=Burkholderia cenocepacia TaxID=95486 RepID=UPI001177F792|nr:GIY-YIG nuclease family protein [Burkholderia cenocepacia]MBJ9897949.1 GIY-YIG nuclease family protein [Burkholderia cenocepacia]MBJ9913750.1 GIY-YIG nuclease family protein [Burkholderia cenocepacia]MBR8117770.1 GIY-YIG nuclease family protein [Burkholderia cenocepacia]MBR8260523.1 GIY-YIG nuclease family protein [Burkholderia cenocepacia]MDN7684186.1 GIY-YIG nuclease family protein [Burkholderia cenocepacia]
MKKDRRLTQSGLPVLSVGMQKNCRAALEGSGALVPFNKQRDPLESLIVGAASCLYEFFHSNGYLVHRAEWDGRKIVHSLLNYEGWVYAFYGENDDPLYVGETDRSFKVRFDEHKRKASWWSSWRRVKVLPCPNQSMRKMFESLIGLAGGYSANKAQPLGPDNIFDDVILSLLVLKNDTGEEPEFPNDMVRYNAEALLDLLST